MTNRPQLREWLFKSLTIEDAMDRMEASGLGVRAGSDPRALQRLFALEDFSATIRSSAMQAAPVYIAFFCLENAVRDLVAERLSTNHGPGWWDSHAASAIRERVTRRQEKEGANRWHAKRRGEEIFYTDFGDLKLIIQNNWVDFEDLFPDQNWVTSRLDELEASRNIIAHTNLLDEREISRLRLYVQDWVRQVG